MLQNPHCCSALLIQNCVQVLLSLHDNKDDTCKVSSFGISVAIVIAHIIR
jgi:hypothetical protein